MFQLCKYCEGKKWCRVISPNPPPKYILILISKMLILLGKLKTIPAGVSGFPRAACETGVRMSHEAETLTKMSTFLGKAKGIPTTAC